MMVRGRRYDTEERFDRIEKTLQSLTDAQMQQAAQIEKQNAGIRDLIVVGRISLDSIKEMSETHQKHYEEWTAEWTAKMKELRDAQAATDEKLNILIDTVDCVIRNLNRNGNQDRS